MSDSDTLVVVMNPKFVPNYERLGSKSLHQSISLITGVPHVVQPSLTLYPNTHKLLFQLSDSDTMLVVMKSKFVPSSERLGSKSLHQSILEITGVPLVVQPSLRLCPRLYVA